MEAIRFSETSGATQLLHGVISQKMILFLVNTSLKRVWKEALEVSGQLHAPAALPPGKVPTVLIGYEAGWAVESVWTTWRRENYCPYRDSISDPSVVLPVASRYTD
jgi:hypothetical protein